MISTELGIALSYISLHIALMSVLQLACIIQLVLYILPSVWCVYPDMWPILCYVVSQLDHDAGECIICLEDMLVGKNNISLCFVVRVWSLGSNNLFESHVLTRVN